ncbi:hypothetical protein L486_06351 [Kwoniella mangroviensis CBS 10435]|uniref:Cysteine-rich transmembrane CYSTM domain-containing protein n=1 Tax=Kwoniella mangroviensis CBS 10435 TaxID=1331196 RepID=A0A1B9ILM3_9TREE|nr:uncharacterized protein I203_07973 [Kwoniella mangroviensis CBS 8507]OCF56407.1 hypothetical protein L486_06351 [Kwoniella mangroviensis CBS 10435]OCF62992.1 hypothetical protein I203_07973 [Kwoniella mangroviensis CBS 8507]OCF79157.1 hypothetical protein I204_01104 [Kwoniella mangroviensis CBS 8886]
MGNQYPQQQGQPGMYQASDGKWYPVSAMPQGHQQGGGFYGQYGQQPPMAPGPQPVYINQQSGGGGGGAGCACCAGICAAMTGLCCLDLCLF